MFLIYCLCLRIIIEGTDCLVNTKIFFKLNYCSYTDETFSFTVKYIIGKAKLEMTILSRIGCLLLSWKKVSFYKIYLQQIL